MGRQAERLGYRLGSREMILGELENDAVENCGLLISLLAVQATASGRTVPRPSDLLCR